MPETVSFILITVLALAAMFLIPAFMTKRALPSVIRALRQHNATSPEGAKTPQEMGLARLLFAQRMFRRRDYKPAALNALIGTGVIKVTSEGKVYLEETHLAKTPFARR